MKSLICLLSTICFYNLSYGQEAQQQEAQPVLNQYNQNLLVNGDAEIEALNRLIYLWEGYPTKKSTDFMQEAYGNIPGEWGLNCDEKCGLPPKAGLNYFRFPVDDAYKNFSLTQPVNLSGFKDTLVVRNINFDLSAFIAGDSCTEADCSRGIISVTFKDADGKDLGTFEEKKDNIDFTKVGNDGAMRKFVRISLQNVIPENSHTAVVSIKGKGDCCTPAFVFFDNITFTLSKGEKREKK